MIKEKMKHIEKIKDFLSKQYSNKIKQIILYGSYARGDFTKDSDIDLLILVDKSLDPWQVRKSLSDRLFEILLEHNELISVIVIPEDSLLNFSYPFLMNVKREGIRI